MDKQIKIIFTATIVEKPREGISPRNGRRWARVNVGGYLGDEFIKASINLPVDMEIHQFNVHEEWEWPIAFPRAGADRKVFLQLRSDPEGLRLLRRITPPAAPRT